MPTLIEDLVTILDRLLLMPTAPGLSSVDEETQWQWVKRNRPALHVPIYANVFPLAYCYRIAIKNKLSSSSYLDQLVDEQVAQRLIIPEYHWGQFPKFDAEVNHHVFIADANQVRIWEKYHRFWAGEVFKYRHGYLLYKEDGITTGSTISDWDVFIGEVSNKKEVVVVTDIEPEALQLKDRLLADVSGVSNTTLEALDITTPPMRRLHDVLSQYALGNPTPFRIFLFGTPFCDFLKENGGYDHYDDNRQALNGIETYVCWRSSAAPSEPIPRLRNFYDFFETLFPSSSPSRLVATDAEVKNLATAFHRIAESRATNHRLQGDKDSIAEIFCRCQDHCEITSAFSIGRKGSF